MIYHIKEQKEVSRINDIQDKYALEQNHNIILDKICKIVKEKIDVKKHLKLSKKDNF